MKKDSLNVIDLDREEYLAHLVGELAGLLQDMVGLDDARVFVSVAGQNMGSRIDRSCRQAMGLERLDRKQVARVIEELSRRIGGTFELKASNECHLVYDNTCCPFGEGALNRKALCMMTSNMFGTIAADNLGYAKVSLEKTIAEGEHGCRVVIYLDPNDERARCAEGQEYLGR